VESLGTTSESWHLRDEEAVNTRDLAAIKWHKIILAFFVLGNHYVNKFSLLK